MSKKLIYEKLKQSAKELEKADIECKPLEEALREADDQLERRVKERTIELTKANEQLSQEVEERKRAEVALQKAHDELGIRVAAHTAELLRANEQLRKEIKERRLAEEALRRSKQKFKSLTEATTDWVWEVDAQGVYTYASPKIKDLLGYDVTEVLGRSPFDLMPKEEAERIGKFFNEKVTNKEPFYGLENVNRHKDGHLVVLETNGIPIFDGKGQLKGYRGIDRDITERKRAQEHRRKLEAQVQKVQRLESVGTLAVGIAHDFNNILMTVQGNVSLMLHGIDAAHHHHEGLKDIEKHVRSGAKLTNQLLGYAGKGRYEVKPIDLNQVVEVISATFGRTRKEITVHRELAEGLFAIEADEGQIEQLLLNLYVNAGDAMPGGGDLILKTMSLTHDDMKDKLYSPKPGNYVMLSITDTGIGMDQETKERIFEPFFTTKERGRGTGIGLASVYGIVKGHAGYIDVDSEDGRGTTFTVYLPATEKRVKKTVKAAEQIIKGSETILLIDDEETVLTVGIKLLKKLGYTVLEAKGGRESVAIYQTNKDKIDLVVLDMIMPDMGGGEAYDRLKELNSNVKVLLSSGYSIDSQAKEILDRGCDGFVQKPFTMKELSGKIRKILDVQ
ncbi:MAG: PAS domain S-box protein [Desulfobacterales bacterium]|nr:PAS domain S-box protein [Desulfobacterales bacterium]